MNMRQGLYGLNEPTLPPKPKTRFRKFLNVVFIICVVIFVSLFTLHKVGGNTEHLRQTIEKFLSESSGYRTKVGKLNAVSFYPLIGIDLENVTMEGQGTDAGSNVVARFSHINFSTSFWSASSGSSFRTVDISDAVISPGVIAPGKIDVARLFIDVAIKGKPKLSFKGKYDNKPMSFIADLAIVPGLLGAVYFTFAEPAPFELKVGDMHAEGKILTDLTGRSAQIENFSAGPKMKPVKMDIALINEGFSTGIKGRVQTSTGDVEYNLSFPGRDKKKNITGSVKAERFEIDDLVKSGGLLGSEKAIRNFYRAGTKPKDTDSAHLNFAVTVGTAHLLKSGKDLGAVEAKLNAKGDVLHFDIIKGSEEAGAAIEALLPTLADSALR